MIEFLGVTFCKLSLLIYCKNGLLKYDRVSICVIIDFENKYNLSSYMHFVNETWFQIDCKPDTIILWYVSFSYLSTLFQFFTCSGL